MLLRFCGTVIALPLAAWVLPGVHAVSQEMAWIAGVLLGILYLVLRPLAKLILSPLNCLSFGLLGFLIDAGFVMLTSNWMIGFTVDGFLWAVVTALLVTIVREGAGKLGTFGREWEE